MPDITILDTIHALRLLNKRAKCTLNDHPSEWLSAINDDIQCCIQLQWRLMDHLSSKSSEATNNPTLPYLSCVMLITVPLKAFR